MSYTHIGDFHYFGFDESPIGGNSSGLVLACTETRNEKLVLGDNDFLKAADYLRLLKQRANVIVPGLDLMVAEGLGGYSWVRSNRGRKFCRQRAAHASIAQLLVESGVEAQKMVVYIDEFFPPERTQELLIDYLKRNYGINLPKENVNVVPNGDREIRLVNFADILAYRIAASFRSKQNGYRRSGKDLPALDPFSGTLDISSGRVETLGEEGRGVLELLLSA
jgi:hypothetical protein